MLYLDKENNIKIIMEIKEIELKDRTITIFNYVEESTMSSAVD
jgi:hypothetical protein